MTRLSDQPSINWWLGAIFLALMILVIAAIHHYERHW